MTRATLAAAALLLAAAALAPHLSMCAATEYPCAFETKIGGETFSYDLSSGYAQKDYTASDATQHNYDLNFCADAHFQCYPEGGCGTSTVWCIAFGRLLLD